MLRTIICSLTILVVFSQYSLGKNDMFQHFENHQNLSEHVQIFWTVNPVRQDITIGLKYFNAPGWVGFGLSQTGSMKGADIVILHLDKVSGQLVLDDRHATDFALPVLDENQNVYLFWKYQDVAARYTEFIYSRPLVSCDTPYDREIDLSSPSTVLFAYGEDQTLQYHGTENRGINQVYWQPQQTIQPQTRDSENSTTIVIRTPTYTITPVNTAYICSYHNLNITGKHHVAEIRTIIDHPDLVHHMILYGCSNPHNSTNQTMKCQMDDCYSFWTGWAVGGRATVLPSNVGLPLGDGPECNNSGCAKYFRLEIHYNNPNLLSGMQDNSGFELILSPQLRQYDQGILVVGTPLEAISIPPYTPSWEITNICPSACLKRWIPPTGINTLGNGFHMHQTGRSIWTQQVRTDQEIAPLGNITDWDFNFQNTLPKHTTILPSDSLITHCVYDTSSRDNVTTGGETSSNEMCFNFISYYPKIGLMGCIDLSYYAPDWAICLEDKDDSGLSKQQWLSRNTVRFNHTSVLTYKPYQPPVSCPCNSSCWTVPTIPSWITENSYPTDTDTTSSASSVSLASVLIVTFVSFFLLRVF